MTFARYSRALWAELPAKVAKPANVQQKQKVAQARPLLNLAKEDNHPPKVSQALAELSPVETSEKLDFSRFSHFSRPCVDGSNVLDRHPLLGAWQAGVGRLLSMSRPKAYPANEWMTLIDDADRFIKQWANQTAHLGWQSWEVWGVSALAPRYRFGAMGLIPILKGARMTAVTAEAAVIEMQTSNQLRFYRRTSDPLSASERALIWELG